MKKTKKILDERILQSYLNRLVDGKLTEAELIDVASDLTNPRELYQRIVILAKSFEPKFIPVFEKYIFYTADLDVAGVSLRALINYHDRIEFLPLLIEFIDGVSWDDSDDLKLFGIHIADSYLSENKNPLLIAAVIRQFESSEDIIIRKAAHEALMSAADIDRRDVGLRIAARGMTQDDLRLDVIEKLKRKFLKS